ncbi:Membrane spanning protein [Acidipropionibacterium acidipropionici ATCC 4875]|uniref:Membrane spanning protein n=1 Tax=Acidipropionibacterium acidipropionici (strain ATCC 4875 / DSM 20272 / JCM 6432 / NBRC 12425 / NCIMB 8070 / 4) TaxID=1171373 RepID=K7RRD7_ACIA4|nr:AI-2E family transporter [Acidipropionibacterium acidipropionici]AFV88861.1 Membrane spanning protein [Acidipropionibacterium acidipropionici ATCC 4875]
MTDRQTSDASGDETDVAIPRGLRTAAGWSWRVLIIAALVAVVAFALAEISEVSIPVAVALMLTAALWPLANFLSRHRVPRGLASGLCLLALIVVIGGIFTLVGAQIASQWPVLSEQSVASFKQVMQWLDKGPLHIGSDQIDAYIAQAEAWAKGSQSRIASWAAAAGSGVGRFLTGLIMALFATFFFIYQGGSIARSVSVLIPTGSRPRILDAAWSGWVALVGYVRAAVIVAFVDGLGAGIGAAIIGSGVAVAIGALTFVLAFIPIAGALIAGVISVAVVLVTLGFVKAVIMLIIFVGVMELESHILQPFLLGKAVSIHPLAILLGIAIGSVLAGIVGALFAIPLVAFGVAFAKALAHRYSEDGQAEPDEKPDEEETGAEDDELKDEDADATS